MKYSKKMVSIVIPNWNGVELLKENLPSVLVAAKGVREIIIVDDHSEDDSITMLQEKFPNILLVRKQKHEGFSSTVNVGVAKATGDIVILLNTDIQPESNFLAPLLSHFEDSKVFAVGCMDKSVEDGTVILRGRGEAVWKHGFYIHWRGEIDESDTAWVSCGSGAFQKDIWMKLGGLDTIFNPFYWEDIDLSYRARLAGYKLVFEPKSIVNHFHEEGMVKQKYSQEKIRVVAYRNQFLFIWKNYPNIQTLLSHCLWTPIRLLQTLVKGDYLMTLGFLQALIRL